ncbi:hypothetical protein ZIOFF_039205 [Zingiber officinale]|uniref:dUTP diphosphatase n=1 Tax=Zingiber officinale TaxID=94328 RepID=A0A8J5KX04_ZINOF|nr:hypothetical protein ZIOFF_039205 [Zingiber officinale]
MEFDLTQGSQLVYVISDTMLTISDFYRNIQISILARGYEGWQNSEANILVTRGMVGRLSNTPNVGFAYEIQNVVDYLITHGVRALPGRRYNTRELLGQNWIINQSSINIPMQPMEVSTRNLLDGRISIQFDNYQAAIAASQPHYNQQDEEIPSDEEEVHHQIIAVLLENPEEILMVKRISNSAILPKRQTEGSAGYDLAINREQFVPKKDKSLLTTGICIQIPRGTYARIAPRSSTALQGLIIMGGVVDEDYRGEVKIIAYNLTNKHIYLQKHECIAQLILERIATPEVMEVTHLETTARGVQGFGWTTNLDYPSEAPLPKVCTQEQAHPECPGCAYCHDGTETAEPYELYVTPTPGYIDDWEYIEYTPIPLKQKQTIDEIFNEYQHFHQESEWLRRRAMTPEDDPMEIAISDTRRILQKSKDYRWGDICKWKLQKHDSKLDEKICAYANGPWIPTEKDLLILNQMEEAWKQLSYKPNTAASHHLAGLPYHLLEQYKELAQSSKNRILHSEEHQKRAHMEDIEWTTARNVINSIRELELICRVKENDFKLRSTQKQGLYFKDAIAAVTNARVEL